MKVGIDAIAFDIPKIHLTIADLASARNIEADKLQKGLGLYKMTLPDVHQDTVVFGANALTKLIEQNQLDLNQIGRIYVGSESSIDSAKPNASFIVGLIEQKFGNGSLSKCDVVDYTFACIGAVDAFQNCLDYIRLNPEKKAIVIATDIAKYNLESSGEYTQGAGSVALLLSADPKIMAFDKEIGISHKSVFDFFKPYHVIDKKSITLSDDNQPWFGNLEAEIEIHKDQPVFDGHYSNECYTQRTQEAYAHFCELTDGKNYLNSWKSIVMHLPYAFQGRRMLPELFAQENDIELPNVSVDVKAYQSALKTFAKEELYSNFVNQKLAAAEKASSQIGNLYTGSIWMGLLSDLSHHFNQNSDLSGSKYGFLAYGSGSKSKVFQGEIQKDWKSAMEKIQLFENLEESNAISFETYEKLHKKELKSSVLHPKSEWVLDHIEREIPTLIGARYYKWID